MNRQQTRFGRWIALTDGTDVMDAEFRAGALAAAAERGFGQVRLTDAATLQKLLASSEPGTSGCAGGIIRLRSESLARAISRHGIPCILMGREAEAVWKRTDGRPVPVCGLDNEAIGKAAARYFRTQNRCVSFAYADRFPHGASEPWADLRYGAFARQLDGDAVQRIKLLGHSLFEDAERLVAALADLPRPVALFAADDRTANDAIALCRLGGLRVPEDVEVLGVGDDVALCEFAPVKISSVRIDYRRLGHTAMKLLLGEIARGTRRTAPLLCPPAEIVERASTGTGEPGDHYVATALRFIATDAADRLNVPRVVAASGASRSYLEKHFRAEIGFTILEAIHRRLLDEIKRMLRETSMSITEIAESAGFTHPSGLCAFFRRESGMSMRDFRAGSRL